MILMYKSSLETSEMGTERLHIVETFGRDVTPASERNLSPAAFLKPWLDIGIGGKPARG